MSHSPGEIQLQVPSRHFLFSIVVLLVCGAFSNLARAAMVVKLDLPSASMTINRFHECSLTVTDANGVGMTGLSLQVRGGMPEHSHGLPTAPRITEEGRGRYRIKGLSFNMPGRWVIEILHDGEPVLRQEITARF